MRDPWTRIVSDRLATLELPDDERADVIEEVAAHLRECAEELEREGAREAPERTLGQVADWPALAARIRRAKETRMAATGMESPQEFPARRRAWVMAWIVAGAVVLGAAGGFATSQLTPEQYRSEALIQVESPQVSSDYVKAFAAPPLAERLRDIKMSLLSRTRLERVIYEFNLYSHERSTKIMEDVVNRFRKDITIEPELIDGPSSPPTAIRVTYTGSSPVTVMKVTEKLAGYLKDESQVETGRRAEGTVSFLETQAEFAAQRMRAHEAQLKRIAKDGLADRRSQLETQVLEAAYTKLLTDLETARMQLNIERRAIGEWFSLVDRARLPERPVGPTRDEFVRMGAMTGLVAGVLVAILLALLRFLPTRRPQQPLAQTA